MLGKQHVQRYLARALAFALAMLFVLFVAQGLTHSHPKGQSEAACQVCQAAHISAGPKSLTGSLVGPLHVSGYVQPFAVTIHHELFFHDSASRAPPSA